MLFIGLSCEGIVSSPDVWGPFLRNHRYVYNLQVVNLHHDSLFLCEKAMTSELVNPLSHFCDRSQIATAESWVVTEVGRDRLGDRQQ